MILLEHEWYIIINPTAGNGKSCKVWSKLKNYLEAQTVQFTYEFTNQIGDGHNMMIDAVRKGFSKFIILGGDGTHHEVVNGLMAIPEITRKSIFYLIYPCGTGNDFARHFRIPEKFELWTGYLQNAYPAPIDVGCILMRDKTSIFFVNEAGIGLEPDVTQRLSLRNSKSGHRLRYLWQALKAIFSFPGITITINKDGYTTNEHLWNLTLANCRYLGGGFQLCPGANPMDGLLSYTKINYVSKWKLIKDIKRFFDGSVDRLPYTELGESSLMLVEPLGAQDVLLEVDGEICGILPVEFRVIRDAINFCIPA